MGPPWDPFGVGFRGHGGSAVALNRHEGNEFGTLGPPWDRLGINLEWVSEGTGRTHGLKVMRVRIPSSLDMCGFSPRLLLLGFLVPVGTRWDPLGPVGTRFQRSFVCENVYKIECFGTAGTYNLYNTKFKVPSPTESQQPGWRGWPAGMFSLPQSGLF